MKKITTIISIIFISIIFVGCSTKSQDDVLNSSKEDVSSLLNKLIEKEKKINKLSKELQNCKNDQSN